MADLSTESESGYRRGGSRRSSGGSDGSSFSNRIFSVILSAGFSGSWMVFVCSTRGIRGRERKTGPS